MRQKRRRVNWFLIILLVVLILLVSYVDRFIIPTVESPFIPTPTITRDPESYMSEAEGLVDEGKFIQAIDIYNEAVRLEPDNTALYIAIAQAQIFAGRYDDALENTSNAILLNPDNSMAYAMRGWALTRQGNLEKADTALQDALRLDPGNGSAHAYYAILLGNMYEQTAGPYVDPITMAIDESNTAMALAPDRLEVRWARGYILSITGNFELAIQQYKAALEINPNISQIHLELGVAYRKINSIDLAVQEYTLANTYNPSDPTPDLYISRAWASVGEFAKAAQSAEDAVGDAPTDPYMRGNWGLMLYELNDWTAADRQFSLAIYGGVTDDGQMIEPLPISGDPWVARYYYTYAILLSLMDRCGDMLALTQQILGALPADEYAVYNSEYARSLCGTNTENPTPLPSAIPATQNP